MSIGELIPRADIDAGRLYFVPAANFNGSPTFTYRVSDGVEELAASGTMTLNVTAVNDPPSLTSFGPSVTFNETLVNTVPLLLDASVTFGDPEGNFDGGTLSVSGALAQDVVSIHNQGTGSGQIGFSAGVVSYQGVAIGTVTGGTGVTPLAVAFNAAADVNAVRALI